MWARPPGYATLVRIVLEQQVSLVSARAAYDRLRAGVGRVTPERVAARSIRQLRALGVTRQKAGYCREIARDIVNGSFDLRAIAGVGDDVARQRLCAIRGIGPWTADIYLVMALRRPDVWPEADLALGEGVRRLKGMRGRPSNAKLQSIAAEWTPWRAVAARIVWHYYLRDKASSRRATVGSKD